MADNETINKMEVRENKGRPRLHMRPQPHDQKKINPTSDTKAQLVTSTGTLPHLQKINPTIIMDAKAHPKPAVGPYSHNQKINSTMVPNTKERPTSTLGSHLYDQKTGPLTVDTEAALPLVQNARTNIRHPYIPMNQPENKMTRSIYSKHGFKTCICWTIGIIILLLLMMGVTVGIIFLVFRPKIPNYAVDSLSISDLRLNFDMSLYAKFDVKITATNPNKKIGIYYRKGSKLSVWYSHTKLCQGSLPKFYQGHKNTTKLDVALTGQNQYGSTLMAALQEQQQTGKIPLDLKIDVPVNIELGKFKLRKIRILGTCLLTVDSLSANSFITIKASTCKFRVKL